MINLIYLLGLCYSSECDGCLPGFYEDPTRPTCLSHSEIPSHTDQLGRKVGIDLSSSPSLTVKRCQITRCEDCSEDYTKCQRCLAPNFLQETSPGVDACVSPIPESWGKDSSSLRILPCSDQNCKVCQEDYQVCSSCPENFLLTLENTCLEKPTESIEITSTRFREENLSAKIIFNKNINPTIDYSQIKTSLFDSQDQPIEDYIISEYRVVAKNSLELTMEISQNLENGYMVVEFQDPKDIRKEDNNDIYLTQQETRISPISFYVGENEAAVEAGAQSTQTSLKVILGASFIFSIPLAFALLKLFQMIDFMIS